MMKPLDKSLLFEFAAVLGVLSDYYHGALTEFFQAHTTLALAGTVLAMITSRFLPSPVSPSDGPVAPSNVPPILKSVMVIACTGMLMSCSAAQLQKDKQVWIKIESEASHVFVVGCSDNPKFVADADLVLSLIPPGTIQTGAKDFVLLESEIASKVCSTVAKLS